MRKNLLAPLAFVTLAGLVAGSARAAAPAPEKPSPLAAALSSLPFRGIGPASMGGRVADIVVHPTEPSTFYVAVGSGGVFKTTNGGVTFTAIFEQQPSYSVGTLALDPKNPDVVYVGTGENVSGRHVGWGDGLYRSLDAGRTWQRLGLAGSQHIGRILIDPRDSNVILVAAEGPLWSPGGERGVYRSSDGGATFKAVLTVDENTGATDLEFDPGNPDVVYAATYERRRHVWGFLGQGEGSGIHKSVDGGKTWKKLKTGLPSGALGKIGLAVTAADPSLVYATLEANEKDRGFYRSGDRGESWEKRNSYISGGTGPHYYQELEASPSDPDLVYQMDVFLRVTRDGGKTFEILESGHDKHSDNHALWIDPRNGRHLLVGTDGGAYESFDEGKTWRHFPNLPISQFYKVALNNREPFYDILGGAQDLGTLHGPSRTMNGDGIRNQDWYVPLGADGYGVAFDPKDPDLMYLMWQEGMLYRKDRRNDEELMIRPQPAPGEAPERWNWDAPLLVSPHDSDRIYYGSQRIWKSDDRGQSWTPISADLTGGGNRYQQKFHGRVQSVDAGFDHGAMSKYATTTAISESPLRQGTLVVGTDDGRVQVTTDGGASWTRATVPGLPAAAFVNDVETSLYDADTLYVAADNHKNGDLAPYLFESRDLGRSWRSMAGDLPAGTLVWAIQQDHVRPELFFAGTEFGIYFSPNAGKNWHKLGTLPTIPFRDLKLHRRDHDLVGATFGRGFFVLDDYSSLRDLAAAVEAEATLFPVRDAWWFVPYRPGQAVGRPEQGTDDFTAPNPPHGALFSYYLKEAPTTAKERRQKNEKELAEKKADVPFPGFDALRAEAIEPEPKVVIVIADAQGQPVRWIEGPAEAGLHRVSWDLRSASPQPVDLNPATFRPPWVESPQGPLVAPGRYSAQLVVLSANGVQKLGAVREFTVKPAPNLSPGTDPAVVAAFQQETAAAGRRLAWLNAELGRVRDQLKHLEATLPVTAKADPALFSRLAALRLKVSEIDLRLNGDPARQKLDEPDLLSMGGRVGAVMAGHWETRQMPTQTQRRDLEAASAGLVEVEKEVAALVAGELAEIEAAFAAAGAPWTPGRRILP